MPLLRNCLIAIAATSAQADIRGFLQAHNATTAVVTQELGEDVKVGDYDAVMVETEEDNSEDVDDEEITEEEGGLTESEVEAIKVEKGDEVQDENKTAISFVQVEQEPESDAALYGQQQLEGAADSDVALYGGASVEEATETETQEGEGAENDNEETESSLESGSDAALYGSQGADESDKALYANSFVQVDNTTATVVTQELGEDVKVGDYDAVMDETEDNSDDVDEDETTEEEGSGFSEAEVEAIKSEKGDESVQDVNNKTDAALVQAAPVKEEVKKVAKDADKAPTKIDKAAYTKEWHKEWKQGKVPSWKETYPKAALPFEDRQSDGKIGN